MTPYSPPPALPRVWEPLLQVIQSHPRYEEPFVRCINELFYGAGPLRVHERHYIALMLEGRRRDGGAVAIHIARRSLLLSP
ncbi:unnamed protein product, partial [Mesorhabditis belari]|uniref:Uncharacterized protein n=1 Tax=Mesorhabditis belari TaxID=2138241 RepID=A0AAF3F888_9BILA